MNFEIMSCLAEPAASVGRRTRGAGSRRRRAGREATGAVPSATRGGMEGWQTACGVFSERTREIRELTLFTCLIFHIGLCFEL